MDLTVRPRDTALRSELNASWEAAGDFAQANRFASEGNEGLETLPARVAIKRQCLLSWGKRPCVQSSGTYVCSHAVILAEGC